MSLNEEIKDHEHQEDDFHFKIYEPKVLPGRDFGIDLEYHLRVISDLIALSRHEIALEDGARVAKVRLRLSTAAENEGVLLEFAIKTMCWAVLSPSKNNRRANVECLTARSIWGIAPVSAIFNSYWTASFFESALSGELDQLRFFAGNLMQQAEPYTIPTFMVFGLAIVAGMTDCLGLMRQIICHPLDAEIDFDHLISRAIPTVLLVLRWFTTHREPAPSSAQLAKTRQKMDDHLELFKAGFDGALSCFAQGQGPGGPEHPVQDTAWSHQACYHLCEMMHAAGVLLTTNKVFLNELIRAKDQHTETIIKGAVSTSIFGSAFVKLSEMAATAAAAAETGTTMVTTAPFTPSIFAAGATVYSAYKLFQSYRKTKEHSQEATQVQVVREVTRNAWSGAFRIRLALDWLRLRGEQDPSVIELSDVRIQRQWQKFATEYSNVLRGGNGETPSQARLLNLWLDNQLMILREQRELLN
ncbi:hypothetical protein B0T25DRAFT_582438 [Lasiosphaeria hispida]|uniref:Uncharacterized protein n=1 Tax=Lasiosphaeria hispida TaxID=260671 RepID=A0AAJ0HES4_9PEZI|nr:hypothetical protein B0T25DRAFT_582438 [Lasiosphaeria hispida]